jgi:hypothetical protein
MTTTSILTIGSVIAVIGLGAWRIHAPRPSQTHVAVVMDTSGSARPRCDAVVGLVDRAITRIDAERGGGTVALFALGDSRSANDPRLVRLVSRLVQSRPVMENKSKAIQERGDLLASIRTACDSTDTTDSSPLVLAMRRALEHLRSKVVAPVHVRCPSSITTPST